MIQANKARQLKGKLAAIKVKLDRAEKRNEKLTVALTYYGKYRNNLFGVGPRIAREALKD